jgi:fucose 4-O-acetylase-like acetyltransferase
MANKLALNTRLNWVDYAKGLGIILVVFGHVAKGLFSSKLIDPVFYYYAVNFVYSFHMPLFFILSGFFFIKSLDKKGNTAFIVNKLETIIYPFAIWSLIQTFIEIKLSAYTNNHVRPIELITCLYLPRSQFWFLFAMFFINIANVAFVNLSKQWGIYLTIALWAAYLISGYNSILFDKAIINSLYFCVGIMLSRYQQVTRLILSNQYVFLLNLLIFIAALYVFFNYPQRSIYNLLFPQLSGSFVIIFIAQKMSSFSLFSIIEYLGINSLAIYLVHLLAGNGTRILLSKILHINNSAVHIIAGTLLGLIIPLFVYRIAMKTKWLDWLFKFPGLKRTRATSEL